MDDSRKKSVLVVDDEKANIIALTLILSPDYTCYAAKNGQDAIETAKKYLPDIILLDILMPEMDGYEVLAHLKNTYETSEIPVIFISGLASHEDEEKGLVLGAADYISKPFSSSIVKLRVRNQLQLQAQIKLEKYLGMTDQLTDVPNRRSFDSRLSLEWDRALRDRTPISIFFIDLDKFKYYNDTYGHLQGDKALQTVAKVVKQSLKRSIDLLARWGGEEFAVLLPMTELSGALEVAEQLRTNVENIQIPFSDGKVTKITVSIGVNVQVPTHGSSIHDFIAGADQALYEAKKTGRNRVCKYEGPTAELPPKN